jgi:hypothetical protein
MKARWLVVVALAVSTPAFADWHSVAPKGEHFSLKFPEAPERRTKDVTADDGSVATLTTYMAKVGFTNIAYALSYGDRPVETPKPKPSELFDLAEQTVTKRYKVFSRKDGKYRGYPSREFEGLGLAGYDEKIRGRYVLVGQRMYMMMVILDSGGGTHDPDVDTFLASLRIL